MVDKSNVITICQDIQQCRRIEVIAENQEVKDLMAEAACIFTSRLLEAREGLPGFTDWRNDPPFVAPDSLCDRDGMPRRSMMSSDRFGAI